MDLIIASNPFLEPNGTDIPVVLLVEDNPIALFAIEHMVKATGCCHISAKDGETAFELARTTSFDLIITDLGLPGISGLTLTKKIRAWEVEQGKNPISIIGLTTEVSNGLLSECLNAGMQDAISKPITITILQTIFCQFSLSAMSIGCER